LPDREEARLTGAQATPGYVWVANHPQYGVTQIPDDPKFITPAEPPGRIWLDDTGVVWQRHDEWAPEHAPHQRWYSTAGHHHEFWPDVCHASDVTTWVELTPVEVS
jgi:hypothetical protein